MLNKKLKMRKMSQIVNRPENGHLITVWDETRKQSVTLFHLSWDHTFQKTQFFTTLHMSTKDLKMWWILILRLQIHFSKQAYSQIVKLAVFNISSVFQWHLTLKVMLSCRKIKPYGKVLLWNFVINKFHHQKSMMPLCI